jgi:D-glycero-D-manno-heptose 1,7-bisphosphate phosphatase
LNRWRYVLLDRDGVINQMRPDYVKNLDEFVLLPGAVEAIARISRSGRTVVVVTNQAAVSRGLLSTETLSRIHDALLAQVKAAGGSIAGFMVCPHSPDAGCDCRKPAPGLFFRARDELGVNLSHAVGIGDQPSDVHAAVAAGCDAILVDALGDEPARAAMIGCIRVRSLAEAAEVVCDA